jgi:hypothetical protein
MEKMKQEKAKLQGQLRLMDEITAFRQYEQLKKEVDNLKATVQASKTRLGI